MFFEDKMEKIMGYTMSDCVKYHSQVRYVYGGQVLKLKGHPTGVTFDKIIIFLISQKHRQIWQTLSH